MSSEKRMLAWAVSHNAHGSTMSELCFLPEGDRPETKANWRRVPWLDEPRNNADDLDQPIYYDHVTGCHDCPYRIQARDEAVCYHSASPDEDGRSPRIPLTTPPGWCPLRERPTLVKLSEGA